MSKTNWESKHPCKCGMGDGACSQLWVVGLQCCDECYHPTRPSGYTDKEYLDMWEGYTQVPKGIEKLRQKRKNKDTISVTFMGGPRDGEVLRIPKQWYPYVNFPEVEPVDVGPSYSEVTMDSTYRIRTCFIDQYGLLLAEAEPPWPALFVGWYVIQWDKSTVS